MARLLRKCISINNEMIQQEQSEMNDQNNTNNTNNTRKSRKIRFGEFLCLLERSTTLTLDVSQSLLMA